MKRCLLKRAGALIALGCAWLLNPATANAWEIKYHKSGNDTEYTAAVYQSGSNYVSAPCTFNNNANFFACNGSNKHGQSSGNITYTANYLGNKYGYMANGAAYGLCVQTAGADGKTHDNELYAVRYQYSDEKPYNIFLENVSANVLYRAHNNNKTAYEQIPLSYSTTDTGGLTCTARVYLNRGDILAVHNTWSGLMTKRSAASTWRMQKPDVAFTALKFEAKGSNAVKEGESIYWNGKPGWYTFKYITTAEGAPQFMVSADHGSLTVLPARVKYENDTQGWSKVTADHPAVYLCGMILNGERISPEWEMIETSDGVYELNGFAARNTNMYVWGNPDDGNDNKTDRTDYPIFVKSFDGKNAAPKIIGNVSITNAPGSSDGKLSPGALYTAVYNKNTNTLEVRKVTHDGLPPFIALYGAAFTQFAPGWSTPTSFEVEKNRPGELAGTTTQNGWESAWVQYNDNATNPKVLLDREGHAMYNTFFPPKNQIYFRAPSDNGTITINSNNLTFQRTREANGNQVVAKSGSEWKSDASLAGDKYTALRAALQDGKQYVRYIVPRVWVNGSFKIWTGWSGSRTENTQKQANLSNHLNLGFGDTYTANGGAKFEIQKAYTLQADKGNLNVASPEYFDTVELFLCSTSQDDMKTASVLYTTKSAGAPSIQAKTEDNLIGQFLPAFGADLSSGITIKDVTIVRYSQSMSTTDSWVPVNTQNKRTTYAIATLLKDTGKSYTKDQFNQTYSKWTSGQDLVNGAYFYGMDITYSDGSTVRVKSNPFFIKHSDIRTVPQVFQLLRETGKENTYRSYIKANSNNEGAMYEVTLAGAEDNTVTALTRLTSYATPKELVDPSKYLWTNKVLIVSEIPDKFIHNDDGITTDPSRIVSASVARNSNNAASMAKFTIDDADIYAGVAANYESDLRLTPQTWTVNMAYKYDTQSATNVDGQTTPFTREYRFTMPHPYVKSAVASLKRVDHRAAADGTLAPYSWTSGQCGTLSCHHKADGHAVNQLDINVHLMKPAIDPALTSSFVLYTGENPLNDGGSYTATANDITVNILGVNPEEWRDKATVVHAETSGITGDVEWLADNNSVTVTPGIVINTEPDITPALVSDINREPGKTHIMAKAVDLGTSADGLKNGVGELQPFEANHFVIRQDGSHHPKIYGTVLDDYEETTGWGTESFDASKTPLIDLKTIEGTYKDASKIPGADRVLSFEAAWAYIFEVMNEVEVTGATGAAANAIPALAESTAEPVVLLSAYGTYEGNESFAIETGIDGVEADASAAIAAGHRGYAEVFAAGAVVFTTDGRAVAAGAGRHCLPAGIYVVRAGADAVKILVR